MGASWTHPQRYKVRSPSPPHPTPPHPRAPNPTRCPLHQACWHAPLSEPHLLRTLSPPHAPPQRRHGHGLDSSSGIGLTPWAATLVDDSTRLVGAAYDLISPRDRRTTLAADGNEPTAPSSSTPPPPMPPPPAPPPPTPPSPLPPPPPSHSPLPMPPLFSSCQLMSTHHVTRLGVGSCWQLPTYLINYRVHLAVTCLVNQPQGSSNYRYHPVTGFSSN